MAVTAARLNVIVSATGAKEVIADLNAMDSQVQQTAGGFDAFYDSISGGAGSALRALDGIARVMGSIAVIGGVSLLAGGARAAWDQVSAVEQATFALGAYGDNAEDVNRVLRDLTRYAQDASRSGGIFWSQDLFRAAQQLVVVGVELENVSEYVQILSRAVGLGTISFDELTRILGRVISSGRITTDELVLLRQAGFQLDDTFKNTNITTEELFAALDAGLPADVLVGQADTIHGAMLYLQGALIDIGQAFLGVGEDLTFIEGGLGDRLVKAIGSAREGMLGLTDTAESVGNAIAGAIDAVESMAAAYQSLPGWMQTAIESVLKLVAAFGALRVASSAIGMVMNIAGLGGLTGGIQALVGSFAAASGGAVGFRAALMGLLAGINPVTLAIVGIGVALGAVAVAWGRHKQQLAEAEAAYASVGDTAREVQDIVAGMRLDGGNLQLAAQIEEINMYTTGVLERLQMVNEYRIEWDKIVNNAEMGGELFISVSKAREFLDSTFGRGFIQWAEDNERLGPDMIKILMSGTGPELVKLMGEITPLIDEYFSAFDVSPEVQQRVSDNNLKLIEAMQRPLVDSEQVFKDWSDARKLYLESPLEPDVAGYDAWLSGYLDDLPQATANMQTMKSELDGLTGSQREFNLEMAQMRIDGDGAMADTLIRMNELFGDNSRASSEAAEYIDFFQSNVAAGNIELDDYSTSIAKLNFLYDQGILSQSQYDLAMVSLVMNAAEAASATDSLSESLHEVGADAADSALQGIEEFNDHLERVAENMEHLMEVAGYGDPLSQWNLSGNATDMSTLAMNAQQAATALENTFRVVVGNTNALASQVDGVNQWALSLTTAEEGLSQLDELLQNNLITQAEHNAAMQAAEQIGRDNQRVQESVLAIQAQQAPIIAEQTSALADYIDHIATLPAHQQRAALGWMDASTAGQAMELQTLAIAAATGQMGDAGMDMAATMIASLAMTDPYLAAVLEDMGLISMGADGTITIHWEGLDEGMSDFDRLSVMFLEFMNLVSDEPITFEMLGLEDPRDKLKDIEDTTIRLGDSEVTIPVSIEEEGGDGGLVAGLDHLVTNMQNAVRTVVIPAIIGEPESTPEPEPSRPSRFSDSGAISGLMNNITVSVTADTSAAEEAMSSLLEDYNALGDGSSTVTVEADVEAASSELDSLQVRLSAFGSDPYSVTIDADATAANAALDILAERLSGYRAAVSVTILEADPAQANTALDNLAERLSGYRSAVSVTTLEADPDQANSELDNLADRLTGYRNAVSVTTLEADPTQANRMLDLLGQRLTGYRNAVSVTTLEANPDQANTALDNLAERLGGYRNLTSTTTLDADSSSAHEVIRLLDNRLGEIDNSAAHVYLYAIDFATSTINSVSRALTNLDGRTATTYTNQVNTVTNRVVNGGVRAYADGGIVRDPVVLVGEEGPELVALPYGSEVFSNSESMAMLRAAASRSETPRYATPAASRGSVREVHHHHDNSTHTTEYIALTESDFQQLLRKSERGNEAYRHLSDPDSHNYGGDY